MNSKNLSFIRLLICLTVLIGLACTPKSPSLDEFDIAFQQADSIIAKIQIPEFPDRSFNILDYGAIADGKTINTDAIRNAIEACNQAGGGQVLIPAGQFLTGPIHLKSHVNLHTEEGAIILFSTDVEDYLPVVRTSYEGVQLMNYSPLIYAFEQENIAVTGDGIFDGQADTLHWWPWSGAERYGYKKGNPQSKDSTSLPLLRKMNENQNPLEERIFGTAHYLRPSFFEPFACKNILVQGVTFKNAPFWIMHPILSSHITIDGVTVTSHGPNNDGCDPEYCQYVHIKNCVFDTGDDCIAIKAGRNNDGRRVNIPSEYIVVENCSMKDGHGGVVLGSEISAGVRHVYVRNCTMDSPNLDRAIRIKTNTLRGGFVDQLYVKNIQVGQVKEATLKINTHYGIHGNQDGEFIPSIKNIYLQDIHVKDSGKYGLLIQGREESIIENIQLKNVVIERADQDMLVEFADSIHMNNCQINGKIYNDVNSNE